MTDPPVWGGGLSSIGSCKDAGEFLCEEVVLPHVINLVLISVFANDKGALAANGDDVVGLGNVPLVTLVDPKPGGHSQGLAAELAFGQGQREMKADSALEAIFVSNNCYKSLTKRR